MAKPVNYRDGQGDKRCSNCSHFADGYCDLYNTAVLAGKLSDGFVRRSTGPTPVAASFSQNDFAVELAAKRLG